MRYFLFVLLVCSPVLADVITLSDGTRFEGDIKREGDHFLVTTSEGKKLEIPASQVKGIALKGRTAATEDRLGSLRRSVENLNDIQQIIDRYQKFIEQNKTSPIVGEAEKDLAQWKDRQAKGFVKAAGRWMTPAEREELRGKSALVADQARDLIKQNRLKEADALLSDALAGDPQNASALYLRGYLQIKQEAFPAARKSLEVVNQLVPNHAPTLNNLAIVLFRQNQFAAAMNAYDQAMLSQPGDVRILTNVAEALNALPENIKTSVAAKKAERRLAEQQTALEPQMAQHGYKRWGSMYVSREDYAKLEEAEKGIKQKLDEMSADYDKTKAQVDAIDRDLDTNQRTMRSLEARSQVLDAQGRLVQIPLPQQYYDVQNDNQKLTQDRNAALAHLDQLRQAAKAEQQKVPTPKYTGIQQPIGVEGTPLAVAGPATQPTVSQTPASAN